MEVAPRYKLLTLLTLFTLLTLLTLLTWFALLTLFTNNIETAFPLLKHWHVCLYLLLGKVRMLLEPANELLKKSWTGWVMDWIPLRFLQHLHLQCYY